MPKSIEALLTTIAKWMAILGGVFLTAVALMTVTSIIGRALIFAGLGPVPGDFELVEQGTAIAVFLFLPWCQMNRGHVTVDVLVERLPSIVYRLTSLTGSIVIALIAIVIAMQLWAGLQEKMSYGETTWILGIPLWWGYSGAMVGAALFVVTSVFTVLDDMINLGRPA